jgi:hypothetical protein
MYLDIEPSEVPETITTCSLGQEKIKSEIFILPEAFTILHWRPDFRHFRSLAPASLRVNYELKSIPLPP